MFRNKQVTLKVEKSPKDPLDELEPSLSIDQKLEIVERLSVIFVLSYGAKVAIDAVGTIAVHVALKGIK